MHFRVGDNSDRIVAASTSAEKLTQAVCISLPAAVSQRNVMKSIRTATFGLAVLAAAAGLASVAHAQSTQQDCAAAIEALNTMITSEQGATTQAREEAERLSQEASDAQSSGDYARCVELSTQATEAMNPG
jgi:hypothetical protein